MAGGSASALSLSRPAQTSLTLRPIGLLSRPRRPLSRGSSPSGCPAELLVSFQFNRQLSGWNLPPLVIRAFGAHGQIRTSKVYRNQILGGWRSDINDCRRERSMQLPAECDCGPRLARPTMRAAIYALALRIITCVALVQCLPSSPSSTPQRRSAPDRPNPVCRSSMQGEPLGCGSSASIAARLPTHAA